MNDKILIGTLLIPGVAYALLTVILFTRESESAAFAPGGSSGDDVVSSSSFSTSEELEPPASHSYGSIDRGPTLLRIEESNALSDAMCAYLVSNNVSKRECERRNVAGLADLLVEVVDERDRNLGWVPLSREKAPSFLAAVTFREVSWQWRDAPRGSLGEASLFQMGRAALLHGGITREMSVNNPYAAARAAIDWMQLGAATCGDVPAEDWLGWYATKGICGGAPDEVEKRFRTARWILRHMKRTDEDG